MARYCIGDHVVVRENLGEDSSNYRYGYAPGMEHYNGQIVTISDIRGDYGDEYDVEYRIAEDSGRFMWGNSDFVGLVDETDTERLHSVISSKATLKEAWGKYCDTDKLVDDVMALLSKYKHRNSEYGVCVMLNEYFTNKKDLIELLSKSKHYMGDMRIVLDIELARDNNEADIYDFCTKFSNKVNAESVILKYADEDGKKLGDYLRTGIQSVKARDLARPKTMALLNAASEKQARFTSNGATVSSAEELSEFNQSLGKFARATTPLINANITSTLPEKYNIHSEMKTSRAFNRMCSFYGVDKAPKYNKLFAQYADMVSGLKRKLKFFISVNPIDYLTMSFGINWASCHTIDKTNQRHMENNYSGMYCAGTVSYMLDSTSIITFVHNHIPTDWEDGKIYRCMFHYGNDVLVQGRVYPQGNDGNTDLYKAFRSYVQNELTPLLGLTDTTWVKKPDGEVSSNVNSIGRHYRDYTNFSHCNVSYPRERSYNKNNIISIGHRNICTFCGEEFDGGSGAISHSRCCIIDPVTGEVVR